MLINYTIWTNETFSPSRDYCGFDGYRAGAHMQDSWRSNLEVDDDATDAQILEQLFYIFNMEHPKGYKAHSLSVGDVVTIDQVDGTQHYYSCESVGWKRLDEFDPSVKNPAWTTYDAYRKAQKVA